MPKVRIKIETLKLTNNKIEARPIIVKVSVIVVIIENVSLLTDKASTSIDLVMVDKLFLKKNSNFEFIYWLNSLADKNSLIPNTNLFLYNNIKYKMIFLKIKKDNTNNKIINLICL